jgi:UDP-N-acetylmuramate--alanine ligase
MGRFGGAMEKVLSGVRNIYLIGIGGVGMSGLALLLKDKGFNVSGSDIRPSTYTKMLEQEGIKVFIGHSKDNINSDIHLVGYSSAVKNDNLEILASKARGITALKRGELLGLLSWDRRVVAVAGSHGKTTTTSLIGYLLTALGYRPAVFIGGAPLNYSRNAWWGSDQFVIETDESDGSFLFYNPWVSIINNIDYEHLDFHKSMDSLKESFQKFAYQTKVKVFGWGDNPFLKEILANSDSWSFGWGGENKIRADNFIYDGEFSCFDFFVDGKLILPVKTPLLGEANVLNTLAAFSFLFFLGEDLERASELLKDFKGIKRRFQVKERIEGVTFVDDYAHHPTEIRAVLNAAHYLKPGRIFVVFEPHRFSRVKMLYGEFSQCFSLADEVIVTDIYSASEKEDGGIDAQWFTHQVKKNFSGNIRYIPSEQLVSEVPACLREGDLCLGLGAGSINLLMDKIVAAFKIKVGDGLPSTSSGQVAPSR